MKIKDVKNEILGGLKDFAAENGFKIRKGGFSLIKKTELCEYKIDFLYNTWIYSIELEPYVNVSFYELQRICEVNGYDLYYTAFINILLLKEIVNNGFDYQKKWVMRMNDTDRIPMEDDTLDYPKMVREVLDLMPYAMDFINDIQDYKDLDRVYNTFPIKKDNTFFTMWDTSQSIIGIIAAKLANNPEYDKVVDVYKGWIEETDNTPDEIEAFYRILNYLETYEPEQPNSLTES